MSTYEDFVSDLVLNFSVKSPYTCIRTKSRLQDRRVIFCYVLKGKIRLIWSSFVAPLLDVVGKVFPGLTGSVCAILSPSILCLCPFHPLQLLTPFPPSVKGKDSFQTHFSSNLPLEYVLPPDTDILLYFEFLYQRFPKCALWNTRSETLMWCVPWLMMCMSVCSLALSQSSICGCVIKALSKSYGTEMSLIALAYPLLNMCHPYQSAFSEGTESLGHYRCTRGDIMGVDLGGYGG